MAGTGRLAGRLALLMAALAALILAVSAPALGFLVSALIISRQHPGVPKLDTSPPTSGLPSGHTMAATALNIGIAVVLAWHFRDSRARRPIVTALGVLLAARTVAVGLLPDEIAGRLDGLHGRAAAPAVRV